MASARPTPRLLAFDVGESRVGVARSTALGRGEPVATLLVKNRPWRLVKDEIEALVREFEIEGFVVGLPRNMDGSLGFQAQRTERFARSLQKAFPSLPVVMEDERLTTEEAFERLAEAGIRGQKARRRVDAAAACLIVEGHLARLELQRQGNEKSGTTRDELQAAHETLEECKEPNQGRQA